MMLYAKRLATIWLLIVATTVAVAGQSTGGKTRVRCLPPLLGMRHALFIGVLVLFFLGARELRIFAAGAALAVLTAALRLPRGVGRTDLAVP